MNDSSIKTENYYIPVTTQKCLLNKNLGVKSNFLTSYFQNSYGGNTKDILTPLN